MNTILMFVPVLVVFVAFQIGKHYVPWLENLAPLGKQLLVVAGCVGASLLYVRLGLPLPDEIRTLQSAAIVGLIQGLAAVGVHGVKKASEG